MKTDEKTVSIRLTKKELWELMENFNASFQDGLEENALSTKISAKLSDAFKKLTS